MAELAAASSHTPGSHLSVLQGQWKGITWPTSKEAQRDPETGVQEEVLQRVGRASVAVPDGFQIHPRLQRHVKHRLQAVESGQGLDWATAEVRDVWRLRASCGT